MVKWYKLVKSLKKVKEKQEYFEEKLAKIEQRTCTETTELREQMELLTKTTDLQEQLRDLMFFLEAQKQSENPTEKEEIASGRTVIEPSSNISKSATTKE